MSWLRSSPLRQSISRGNSAPANKISTECDPSACYDSFCKHWQQAYDVILKAEVSKVYLIRNFDLCEICLKCICFDL